MFFCCCLLTKCDNIFLETELLAEGKKDSRNTFCIPFSALDVQNLSLETCIFTDRNASWVLTGFLYAGLVGFRMVLFELLWFKVKCEGPVGMNPCYLPVSMRELGCVPAWNNLFFFIFNFSNMWSQRGMTWMGELFQCLWAIFLPYWGNTCLYPHTVWHDRLAWYWETL